MTAHVLMPDAKCSCGTQHDARGTGESGMSWFQRHLLSLDSRPLCHCGQPVTYGYDGDPTHHRGMCEHCDAVRCDAYPGECGR